MRGSRAPLPVLNPATGEAVGCFGLTEPDHGSDPSGMKTGRYNHGTRAAAVSRCTALYYLKHLEIVYGIYRPGCRRFTGLIEPRSLED